MTVLIDETGVTWEWNGSTWTRRSPAASPPSRLWTTMAYDSIRGQIVLFGGNNGSGGLLGDTWVYDGSTWTRMSPASSPSPRFGAAMDFDPARGVVVLFGGRTSGQRMNDTWVWDGTNWTQQSPATVPYPRFWHSMAYDAQLGETVMFGGDHVEPNLLGPINDTWLWDGTNWTRDWPATAPTYRAGQAMAYDSATGRVTLFGGTDESFPGNYLNDTWELGPGIVTPAGSPAMTPRSTSVTFSKQDVGTTSAPFPLRILSSGTGPLVISTINAPADFNVDDSGCPISPDPLAAGSFCTIQVTFIPTSCGNESETSPSPTTNRAVGNLCRSREQASHPDVTETSSSPRRRT